MSKKTISGQHNGFEFVEIAGIKWATCNVGAEKPTDFGLYFQWGDRKGYTADEVGNIKRFNCKHYKHHDGIRWTKYNKLDNKQELDLRDDAAFAYMGQGWRMPTQDDFRCLLENTIHWQTNSYQGSGVNGMVFKDRTDGAKELFFPAAGKCDNSSFYRKDYYGYFGTYWSRTLFFSYHVFYAYRLYIGYGGTNCLHDIRFFGHSVRGILTI